MFYALRNNENKLLDIVWEHSVPTGTLVGGSYQVIDDVTVLKQEAQSAEINWDVIEQKLASLDRLKIHRYISTDPQYVDFTLLGLVKASPLFRQGRKVKAEYFADASQTDLVVQKLFSDQYNDGELTGIQIDIQWLNESGEVGLTKRVFKPLNSVEAQQILRKRRERALDYLQEAT